MLTYDQRDAIARNVVMHLGADMQAVGQHHEEVVCVLLHAVRLAEELSTKTHAVTTRPPEMPQAPQVIADCKAALQRRAG